MRNRSKIPFGKGIVALESLQQVLRGAWILAERKVAVKIGEHSSPEGQSCGNIELIAYESRFGSFGINGRSARMSMVRTAESIQVVRAMNPKEDNDEGLLSLLPLP
ncbi:hypothetical protein ST47_g7145 [Ascochyta rabiei]|uniref:Uncharacterized protein n=1 Tax=Didymella rabiei TaxID=5454 RepID=A0A163BGJ6_DIDRA|nr:hypothetical protein ST47_g7145 [Ascochyta rabiei]